MPDPRSALRVPSRLLEDLRQLARTHGTLALVDGCAQLVAEFAAKGVAAELASRQGPEEPCPKCRERKALFAETRRMLRPHAAEPAVEEAP